MTDPQLARFMAESLTGRLSRKQMLALELKLGVTTPVLTALWSAAPAIPGPREPSRSSSHLRPGESTGSFTIVRDGASPDIDPHAAAYDNLSSMLFLGLYEMLVRY